MLAIFKRELKAYFSSPIGYIFIAAIYCFGGLFFSMMLSYSSSNISYVFSQLLIVVLILTPILTMRLLSEDKKQKTDQLLLTAPVNTGSIVIGKYLAASVMLLIGAFSTVIYTIVLATFTTPNWNIFLGNLLALILVGGALISIGLLISSLTESQMVAAIVTFVAMLFIILFDNLAASIPVEFISATLGHLSIVSRYNDLISGILNVSHLLFFASVIVVFNFFTARILERKRWSK